MTENSRYPEKNRGGKRRNPGQEHPVTEKDRNVERERYRQEMLEGNWSEDWGRLVDEKKVTPGQYVLIVLMILLLSALLALGAFWMYGRSGGRGSGQSTGTAEISDASEEQVGEADIVILDPQSEE